MLHIGRILESSRCFDGGHSRECAVPLDDPRRRRDMAFVLAQKILSYHAHPSADSSGGRLVKVNSRELS
jgi:hypothetical protein